MGNTFFWFRNNQVSIDLTRFDRRMVDKHPKITKESIKFMEVYIGVKDNYKKPEKKIKYVLKNV